MPLGIPNLHQHPQSSKAPSAENVLWCDTCLRCLSHLCFDQEMMYLLVQYLYDSNTRFHYIQELMTLVTRIILLDALP